MKLFIVGAARSGTTLMARILGRHPEIHTLKELHFFEELWSPKPEPRSLSKESALRITCSLMKNQYEQYVSPTNPTRYRAQAQDFLQRMPGSVSALELFRRFIVEEAEAAGKWIPCTQTPRNVYYLAEILGAYEDARVIWMLRDPRAVLCSQKHRWRRTLWRQKYPASRFQTFRVRLNYHPITYALIWRGAVRAGAQWEGERRVWPVRFEDLVGGPEATVLSLLQWLNLEVTPDLLDVPMVGSSLLPDRRRQRGIDQEALGRWKAGCLTDTEVRLCEWVTSEEMDRFGYPPMAPGISWLLLTYYLLSWVPRSGLAFLLNRGRTGSPLAALRRRLGLA